MANENVGRFEELLKGSEEMQAKLQELTKAFDGDKNDGKALFEATVGKLAAEAGLPFSFEEGAEFANANRELSDAELEAVAGGGVCYFVGANPGVDSECTNNKGSSCAYVGVSIDDTW